MPTAFEELNREAERQGLRVLLSAEGHGKRARLGRVKVVDREGGEVVALRLTARRGLEETATACLRFLVARRAEA